MIKANRVMNWQSFRIVMAVLMAALAMIHAARGNEGAFFASALLCGFWVIAATAYSLIRT